MASPETPSLHEQLLASKKIRGETIRRLSADIFESIPPQMVAEYEALGWVVDKRLKTKVKMRRPKSHDSAFEDRVWAMMAKLNFTSLNRDRKLRIEYGATPNESHQIDVFAADDEVVLVIECKSSSYLSTNAFKKDVEAIQGYRTGMIRTIRKDYPNHKIKFVLATNNFGLTLDTQSRIRSAEIVHMDEDTVDYYMSLADHLGKAARYQLLGNLFSGVKIPGIEPRVPAIQGKMGGYTYYSFAIEPARLLKFSYVLHRNKANSILMPTYQRLIKKSRLQKVAEFVNEGGFFPNSIILNVEGGRNGLRFERNSLQQGIARLGILHLPQTYRSAYVIDGQHRLYGYAGSPRAEKDLIPVVAFVDLPRNEQVKIFMQINENQQAVPKNLRNTLNADLLWDSDDYREQIRALKLRTAQHLGENKTSPLYGRVLIGENSKTLTRCITIEVISIGLSLSNLIGTFTKSQMRIAGSLYRGSNDSTFPVLADFLESCFSYMRAGLTTQWELGSSEGGFVFINPGIESMIRLFSDVVDHLIVHEGIVTSEETGSSLASLCEPYLDPVIAFLKGLTFEEAADFRRQYGSGGRTKYWRRLQIALNAADSDFSPQGFAEYVRDQEKAFNLESFEMVRDLELFLSEDIHRRLVENFGNRWLKSGVPMKVQQEATAIALEKNQDRDIENEVTLWDCLHLIDYHKILTFKYELWQSLYSKRYTRPGEEEKPGKWTSKADWLFRLNTIRNRVDHEYTVGEEDYEFLVSLTSWLVKGEVDNTL